MGEKTGIEWCHHTFNPWRGCARYSAGCANCYAEAMSGRNPAVLGEWGPSAARPVAADAYWLQALSWHQAAVDTGEVRRVFVGSLMDVGEDRRDLDPWRDRLMALIALTPLRRLQDGRRAGLHWLLLTKRPAALRAYLDAPGLYQRVLDAALWWRWRSKRPELIGRPIDDPGPGRAPGHRAAWFPQLAIGVSVENQSAANERVPELLRIDVARRFLSMEPLLGPVDLDPLWCDRCETAEHVRFTTPAQPWCSECDTEVGPARWLEEQPDRPRIDGIFLGGESGPRARPMHPAWVRSLRDQAKAANVAFLFKQWGEWLPQGQRPADPDAPIRDQRRIDFTADLYVERIGKRAAGRDLDGRTWDDVPDVP